MRKKRSQPSDIRIDVTNVLDCVHLVWCNKLELDLHVDCYLIPKQTKMQVRPSTLLA